MRYAIFTDVHANLEALEAVLAKIDELAQEEPVDQIWFLGDLVGYGPNPNECIVKLRERTDVIIAGNHDWAAVGKLDLDDFSEAARISAEWTAEQLTEEHRNFLSSLPERLEMGACTLVHGSPYGPLWEYLTSEVLAERSFQYFNSRYCLVGHTHVPIIFQQPDTIANEPTHLLSSEEQIDLITAATQANGDATTANNSSEEEEDTAEIVAVRLANQAAQENATGENSQAAQEPRSGKSVETTSTEDESESTSGEEDTANDHKPESADEAVAADELVEQENTSSSSGEEADEQSPAVEEEASADEEQNISAEAASQAEAQTEPAEAEVAPVTPEETILNAEDRFNQEIEELLTLLGLSQSMVQITNEMIVPPEGHWQAPEGYRAIINPGGVGQPRDGDARAAFMIYDTKRGFTFYRIPYDIEKTQEKIIKAGLPPYLAARLAYGR
ncbi:hypothetical protein EPA93_42875 [Ktedonosporobacter rubrisoli]|uniref:Calcineurin-like phosphoesterase domain-containing protein n=1 Tax=Ktedonosporobacter rubrisoli TaxID=2509675 RepID=A0A4P6K386_KTERU|nr:metallophosphoesterase family protein [Ktedonosporobacter rubrisoli]QBD82363.1 hypothetical protein EPA93_42875 [Ktedonosporobacter rubrisoli]